ncbi:MAG: zf-HC2 domain-containing protein [Gemmatimonadetes bacterium]|nr:zf-HC2 domain-containing protein [Gemmatimonadota bacterium]
MSGPRDEMMCAQAIASLYPYLDGELSEDLKAAIRQHLAACAPCFAAFELERAFLRFVEARTRLRECPRHLRRRVAEAILAGPPHRSPDPAAPGNP